MFLVSILFCFAFQGAFAAVGATSGKADVSAIGTATYSIPFWAPSGTADLTPTIGLSYDSRRQNGLVGVGFALAGQSAITRCAKTIAQDGVAGPVQQLLLDKYCLDGNRLRLAAGTYGSSGSEYRTEVDEISKIVASGSAGGAGPASFTVRKKSGLDYEYGTTSSSRIEFANSSIVRVWALSKIIDRSGNVIEFTYIEDGATGGFRPDEIRYTTNPSQGVSTAPYVIKYQYQTATRPDPIYRYFANSPAHEFKRLASVEVRSDSSIVRQYVLTHAADLGESGRSRLESVQECAATTSDCFSPTIIDWTDSSASFGAELDTNANIPFASRNPHLIDVDGDGRDDLVYVSSTVAGGTWRIRKADAAGGFGNEINTTLANTNHNQSMSLDWDGDGKVDLAVPYVGNRWHIFRSNGNGFDTPFDTGITAINAEHYTRLHDLDGDGRDDLVRISASGAATVWVRYRGATNFGAETVAWSSGDPNITFQGGFDSYMFKYRSATRRADINGDGREEFLAKISTYDPKLGQTTWSYYAFFSGVPGAPIDPWTSDKGGQHLWLDLNGDGLTDLVWIKVAGGFRYALSTGQDLGAALDGPTTSGYISSKYVVADHNGDGNDDILIAKVSPATLHYLKSTGDGLQSAVDTEIGMANAAALYSGDLNGSGYADLLLHNNSTDAMYRLHDVTPADLLDTVTDGFGIAASFVYAPMTKPGLHTPLTGATYPVREFQSGAPIVETLSLSDGIDGFYDLNYAYKGARMHRTGRGFLGFNEVTATDTRTGNKTILTYEQDAVNSWERIGSVLTDVRQTAASKYISETTYVWSNTQSGSGFDVRRFPYVGSRTIKSYEINSVGGNPNPHISTQVRSATVDAYGTITNASVITTEHATGNHPSSSKTIAVDHITLSNDDANWCLGRPTQTHTTASHSLTDGASITRRLDQTWDSLKCRPTQKIVEPTSSLVKITTGLGYDNFGNINSVTVTPVNEAARLTTYDWGKEGRFLESVTNPLSQTHYQSWNEGIGKVATLTDPNALVSSWQYDSFARSTREIRADGTAASTEYLACDADCTGIAGAEFKVRLRELRHSNNAIFSEAFVVLDGFGRELRRTNFDLGGAKIDVLSAYNNLGQLSQRSQPYFNGTGTPIWTELSYDVLGRRVGSERSATNDDDSTPAASSIDYQGLTTVVTDPLLKPTTEIRNGWGTIDEIVDADNQDLEYEYDGFGNLTQTTDPAGHVIDIDYNVVGFKTSSSDPDMGVWTYDYFALGELKSQTNARGQTVSYSYDKLSRPLTRVEPEGTTTWTWDATSASCSAGQTGGKGIGRLATVSSPGGYQEKHCYDNISRPKIIRTVANGGNFDTEYTYHSSWGLLETLRYPASTGTRLKIKYEYETANKSGLMKAVKDFNSPYTAFWQATSTDAFRQYQDVTLGNGLQTYRSLDSITGALRGIETGPGGGTARQQLAYLWNKSGYLAEREDLNQSLSETFSYDDLYRLEESQRNGVVNLSMDYSSDGNIASKSDIGNYDYVTEQAGCNYETHTHTQPHAVRKAGSKIYCYDQNGNMTKRDGATISWASYDLPTVINQTGGNSSTFSYGADRQRYKQVAVDGAVTKTTVYIQGGLFEKITFGSSTEYKHHIVGGDGRVAIHTRRSPGASDTIYLLQDHLGSTDKITDSGGAIKVHLSYDAFGQRRGANWSGTPSGSDWATIKANTQRGYTDHEQLDNLNLIHMNGRVYDPAIGRFQSADPYVPEPYNGQSFNRYSYVNNSPLSYTDPSGFWWVGVDNANLCDGDCYFTMELNFHWSDWVGFADLGDGWSTWREHSSADDTVIPHPERSDEYDDDWQWAKDIGKGIADFVILDSVRGALDVYEAVRAGDYQRAAIGMAGLGCDVVKACKAVERLADGAKNVVRAARGGTYVLKDADDIVRKTGRTNDLARREKELGRKHPDKTFEVDKRTDNYAAQRGREQIIHDANPSAHAANGGLDRINGISPDNPNIDEYLRAAEELP